MKRRRFGRPVRLAVERLEDRLVLDVTINVDAATGQHAINPDIYGVAFADGPTLLDLGATVNRHGGNTTSRYNWQADVSNRAQDWFFESLPDGNGTPGGSVDSFITATKAGGAQPVITVPMLDWVARLGSNGERLASFAVSKYGSQQATDFWFPDAGNGVRTNGSVITGNDPADANRPSDANFQRGWLQHLVQQWGSSNNGGVRYYDLDNEASIWHATHRDVHPNGATMDEMRDKMIAFAQMIKSVDPGARVIGPEEWG